jgi:acetyl-CoA C-acetyltransferase
MTDIIIASAARTPIGAFSGTLSPLPAHVLGENAIREALKRATVEPGDVSEVIMGQILTAGAGMNPARQAALAVGVPAERTAYMVNQVCGSGHTTRGKRCRCRRRSRKHEQRTALHSYAKRRQNG